MKQKKVFGVGIYEKGVHIGSIDGVTTRSYRLWSDMLRRCDPNGLYQIKNPSYQGCSVHPAFIRFQDFAEWCQTQIGFSNPDFQLDKDILHHGNKLYGPDTCVFVPKSINVVFTFNQTTNSPYPAGVTRVVAKSRFKASINVDGGRVFLGYYNTSDEAYDAYKVAKVADIHRHAELWKNQIDLRVYESMINYRINR